MPSGGQPLDKVRKIFDVLGTQPLSLSTLAKQVGMHYYTLQGYIEMIIEIQQAPPLEKIESARTVLVRLQG